MFKSERDVGCCLFWFWCFFGDLGFFLDFCLVVGESMRGIIDDFFCALVLAAFGLKSFCRGFILLLRGVFQIILCWFDMVLYFLGDR